MAAMPYCRDVVSAASVTGWCRIRCIFSLGAKMGPVEWALVASFSRFSSRAHRFFHSHGQGAVEESRRTSRSANRADALELQPKASERSNSTERALLFRGDEAHST